MRREDLHRLFPIRYAVSIHWDAVRFGHNLAGSLVDLSPKLVAARHPPRAQPCCAPRLSPPKITELREDEAEDFLLGRIQGDLRPEKDHLGVWLKGHASVGPRHGY